MWSHFSLPLVPNPPDDKDLVWRSVGGSTHLLLLRPVPLCHALVAPVRASSIAPLELFKTYFYSIVIFDISSYVDYLELLFEVLSVTLREHVESWNARKYKTILLFLDMKSLLRRYFSQQSRNESDRQRNFSCPLDRQKL